MGMAVNGGLLHFRPLRASTWGLMYLSYQQADKNLEEIPVCMVNYHDQLCEPIQETMRNDEAFVLSFQVSPPFPMMSWRQPTSGWYVVLLELPER